MDTFNIGRSPVLTKEQKKQQKREKDRVAVKKNKRVCVTVPRRLWRILPCNIDVAFTIDTLKGKSYFEKMRSLEEFGSSSFKKSPLFPDFKQDEKLQTALYELKKKCKEKLAENQILRWKFKRFLTRMRLRKFKTINDTDYITMSPIEKSVQIYHFPTRSVYAFESVSILQDIHKKLLNHDGQIPHPIFPRNPYTNEYFNIAQLLSIQRQCKLLGNTSWILEAFCKAKLCIPSLLQVQRKALRIHALKSILYDYTNLEGTALLLDFIESQHDEHQANFNRPLYRWCLLRIPEEPKIQSWRSFCKEYYEDDILAEDDTERDNSFLRVARKTGILCAPPNDLLAKRNLHLHLK